MLHVSHSLHWSYHAALSRDENILLAPHQPPPCRLRHVSAGLSASNCSSLPSPSLCLFTLSVICFASPTSCSLTLISACLLLTFRLNFLALDLFFFLTTYKKYCVSLNHFRSSCGLMSLSQYQRSWSRYNQ